MFKTKSQNRVDTVFVLMIFCVFAVSVFLVLILGGSTYQNMNDISQEGQNERIVLSYIRTKTRNIDNVAVSYFNDVSALELVEVFGTRTFVTMIYLYDGWVRELFHEQGNAFQPGDGVPIMEVSSLDFAIVDGGLIRVSTDHGSIVLFPRSTPKTTAMLGFSGMERTVF